MHSSRLLQAVMKHKLEGNRNPGSSLERFLDCYTETGTNETQIIDTIIIISSSSISDTTHKT